jgi:hypothetical protein
MLTKVLTKSHLEQAVFFESKPNVIFFWVFLNNFMIKRLIFLYSQNPLTFPLYPNAITYVPALNQSAILLSREIVSGGMGLNCIAVSHATLSRF